jgi:hypothetical protein
MLAAAVYDLKGRQRGCRGAVTGQCRAKKSALNTMVMPLASSQYLLTMAGMPLVPERQREGYGLRCLAPCQWSPLQALEYRNGVQQWMRHAMTSERGIFAGPHADFFKALVADGSAAGCTQSLHALRVARSVVQRQSTILVSSGEISPDSLLSWPGAPPN